MKKIQRYSLLVICTVVLLVIACCGATGTDIVLPRFCVQSTDGEEVKTISLFDAKDGNYYVFLPSYADMRQVTVSVSEEVHFALNDTPLADGMACEFFELQTPYSFFADAQMIATLWFYRSENVASMFLDTATGSMAYIHRDKNHEESASVRLYTADGVLDYSDEKCVLKGRGNSSWGYDKHPYALTLSQDADLMGMGEADSWILLANASDETNLNNKLILDLASRTGFLWTPECQWVDVYLNGEYNGLYLLAEKVEAGENRLDIRTESGDFLCKIDLEDRWTTLRHPFMTEGGRAVEIADPRVASKEQLREIERLVNQMEQEILGGMDLSSSSILDLDSLVRRYIIDEVAGNIDSDIASCFYYYSEGKFFAGPVWDYDMALGNCTRNQEPHAFIAKNVLTPAAVLSPYYRALYANESFLRRVEAVYRDVFVPELERMVDEEIDRLSGLIQKASEANSLRWRSMYDDVQSWYPYAVKTAAGIKDYLSRRIDFLSSAWLEGVDYCTVQFRPAHGSSSWNISVQKGNCLKTSYIDTVSTVWLDSSTGKPFDFGRPIMTDMILLRQEIEEPASGRSLGLKDYAVFMSLALLAALLAAFAVIDVMRRRRERGSADGHD